MEEQMHIEEPCQNSHRQPGPSLHGTSWVPEVALVTINVQDHVNESVPSLAGPPGSLDLFVPWMWGKEENEKVKSQDRQPEGSSALHDSSARWSVAIVGHLDLTGSQTVVGRFVLAVECIWGWKITLDYYITIYIRVLHNDGSDIALSLPIFMLLLPKATNDKNRMSLYKLLHTRKEICIFSEANNTFFIMQFFLTVVWRSPILRPEAAVFDSWAGRHRSSECSSRHSAAARDSPPAPLPTRQQILQDLHLLKYTDYDAVPGMIIAGIDMVSRHCYAVGCFLFTVHVRS